MDQKTPESDYAVMIVGGGPAGISTWLHLHEYDPHLATRSLVVEKSVFPRDKLCAGGLGGWSAGVLHRLGVDLDIPFLIISDVEFRFDKEVYCLHQPHFFQIVQRLEFDHALAKAAVQRGLELHEGEIFIDAARDRNRLIVTTSKETYSVSILVGCDGSLSRVRRKMIPRQQQHLARTIQIYAPADPQYDSEFDKQKVVWDFTPVKEGLQGYVYHFPCLRDGVPSIAHGLGDNRFYSKRPRANLKEIFSRELRSRNIDSAPASWSSHPIRWLSMDDIISRPNVMLAGDAAGIEPAFGGGIHIALSYGEVVALSIVDAFQKNDFSFNGYQQRLQHHLAGKYIRECTSAAIQMYGGKVNPLTVARNFFTKKNDDLDLLFRLHSALSSSQKHGDLDKSREGRKNK